MERIIQSIRKQRGGSGRGYPNRRYTYTILMTSESTEPDDLMMKKLNTESKKVEKRLYQILA